MFWLCPPTILLTKTTATQNYGVLSYNRVRGLYFLAVVFAMTVILGSRLARHVRDSTTRTEFATKLSRILSPIPSIFCLVPRQDLI